MAALTQTKKEEDNNNNNAKKKKKTRGNGAKTLCAEIITENFLALNKDRSPQIKVF
jgi:hypothetical protein